MRIKKVKICVIIMVILMIFLQTISIAAYEKIKRNNVENRREIIEIEETKLSREERDTLNLINEYREKNGLKSLKPYSKLQEVAKLKAEDLVNNNYFAHYSDKLGTPFEMLESNGITYKIAGENLAGNTTPERAVQAWIDSEDHRANILEERFEYTGIYVIDSEIYGKIYVQLFMGI